MFNGSIYCVCVCVDSGQPGDGDTVSGAQDTDRSSAEGKAAAETKELDAGQYFNPRLVLNSGLFQLISPDASISITEHVVSIQ